MKKKKYFCILLVATQIWMLSTCNYEHDLQHEHNVPKKAITVEEAKFFFEVQIGIS